MEKAELNGAEWRDRPNGLDRGRQGATPADHSAESLAGMVRRLREVATGLAAGPVDPGGTSARGDAPEHGAAIQAAIERGLRGGMAAGEQARSPIDRQADRSGGERLDDLTSTVTRMCADLSELQDRSILVLQGLTRVEAMLRERVAGQLDQIVIDQGAIQRSARAGSYKQFGLSGLILLLLIGLAAFGLTEADPRAALAEAGEAIGTLVRAAIAAIQ